MSKSEMRAYIDKHGEMNVAETYLDARYDDVEQLANDLGCNCYRYRDMDLFNRNLYAGAFHFCK